MSRRTTHFTTSFSIPYLSLPRFARLRTTSISIPYFFRFNNPFYNFIFYSVFFLHRFASRTILLCTMRPLCYVPPQRPQKRQRTLFQRSSAQTTQPKRTRSLCGSTSSVNIRKPSEATSDVIGIAKDREPAGNAGPPNVATPTFTTTNVHEMFLLLLMLTKTYPRPELQ